MVMLPNRRKQFAISRTWHTSDPGGNRDRSSLRVVARQHKTSSGIGVAGDGRVDVVKAARRNEPR
jgi:hypothetical protein